MTWFDACARSDVPSDRGWPVTLAGRPIAVFRDGDEVRALDNVCRHIGSPIDDGPVEAGCVTCPWHGWRYDLATGDLVSFFGHQPGIRAYAVRVVGDRVLVDVT
jgi:nitrite reductase/ring-hydroxylating ferredoxin subunit